MAAFQGRYHSREAGPKALILLLATPRCKLLAKVDGADSLHVQYLLEFLEPACFNIDPFHLRMSMEAFKSLTTAAGAVALMANEMKPDADEAAAPAGAGASRNCSFGGTILIPFERQPRFTATLPT